MEVGGGLLKAVELILEIPDVAFLTFAENSLTREGISLVPACQQSRGDDDIRRSVLRFPPTLRHVRVVLLFATASTHIMIAILIFAVQVVR